MTSEQITVKPNASQEEAMKALHKHGKKRSLVVLPSGSGKTYLGAFDAKRVGAESVLYVVHRNEIVQQAKRIFKEVHNISDTDIGTVDKRHKEFDKPFVFATIQTIAKKKNLREINKRNFDYTIIDEYHHVAASSYKNLLNNIHTKFLLGLTATPYRADGKDIKQFVNNNISFEMNLKEGIEKKILVPFVYFGLWDNINYDEIEWKGKKYLEKDLDKTLVIRKRDQEILREFRKSCQGRQTIGFCVSVRHVERITKRFNEAGISAAGVTHLTNQEKRKKIVDGFRKGEYKILFTRDIFNEGVDFPEVKALLFMRPTFSKVVFLQQLGRGLRTAPNKRDVLVLDFIGNYVNAYKRKSWIEWISGNAEKLTKPVYYYNGVSQVYFNRKVVNLFKFQESRLITKENLTKNYKAVKKAIGHQPNAKEMDRYGEFSCATYWNYFGTWNKFLHSIGEPLKHNVGSKPTRKELEDNYWQLKKKLGRQPTKWSLTKNYGSRFYKRHYKIEYGNWSNFLKSIGEPANPQYHEKGKKYRRDKK